MLTVNKLIHLLEVHHFVCMLTVEYVYLMYGTVKVDGTSHVYGNGFYWPIS